MRRIDNAINSHITENPNNLHSILRKSEPKNKIKSLKNGKTGKLVEEHSEVAEMFAEYLNDQQGDKVTEDINWHEVRTNIKTLSNIISTPNCSTKPLKQSATPTAKTHTAYQLPT